MNYQERIQLDPRTFMLVDAGGGTVDVTVHNFEKGQLKEVIAPSGGKWGSVYVDEEYGDFLERLFGGQLQRGSEDGSRH